MSIMSIICDFMLRVICAAGLYAYAYHRGQQAGCACATAPETETADAQWRAAGVYTAAIDVLATGYSIEDCLWRRAPERREVRRGKKFSSFFANLNSASGARVLPRPANSEGNVRRAQYR